MSRLNAVEILRAFVRHDRRSHYAVTFVRVEDVDHERRKCEVSLKSDSNNIIEDVPIASQWARDEVGLVIPIKQGDEGLLLHPREPLEKQIQQRGEQESESERRFELESAVLLPMLWLDEDKVPEHEPNELALKHDSGSYLRLDEKGVHIGPELYVDGIPFTQHGHPYDWTDPGGSSVTDPPEDDNQGGAPEVNNGD